MSSPFSTFEEFSNAKGPIYTFANSSAMITVLLIISLVITIYFFYASFSLKQETEKSLDAKAVGLLLIAGLTTITTALFNPQSQKPSEVQTRSARMEQATHQRGWQPLALLGLAGLGGTSVRQSSRRLTRKYRMSKRSR